MKARIAGASLVAILLALIAVDAVRVGRNWSSVKTVTTPAGAAAPDFELPGLDGGRVRLSSARGTPVVLAFWATWCEPCRAELPELDRLARKLTQVRFYAVNIEGAERKPDIAQFRDATHLTMPILYDGNPVGDLYRVETIPHLVIIDAAGQVKASFDGARPMSEIESVVTR